MIAGRRRMVAVPAILAAAFVLAAAAIIADGLNDRLAPSDVAIVLGNEVLADGTPSPRLKARLDRALEVWRAGLVRSVIVSGGTGRAGFDEAQVMGDYLTAHGVPAPAVLRDDSGVTTWATATNSAALMRAHGFRTAMVVTQYFHVSRTRLALRKQGVRVTGSAHAHICEARDLYSTAREVVGYARYLARRGR